MNLIHFFRKKREVYQPININDINFVSIDDLKDFIYKWNVNYPIDRWWREKHKVAFNSSVHRVTLFSDMRIEWEEDLIYRDILKDKKKTYIPNVGDWLEFKEELNEENSEQSFEEFKEEFRNMDLSQFDDIDGGSKDS